MIATPEASAGLADSVPLCPRCGHDTRVMAGDRCPECGLELILARGDASRLPWTYRRTNGWCSSYLRTLHLISFSQKHFAAELSRQISLRDARRFWLASSLIISAPVLAVAGACTATSIDPIGLLLPISALRRLLKHLPPDWQALIAWDFALPLSTGWHIAPIAAVVLIAAVLGSSKVLPALLNRPSLPMPRRARAVALAHYAIAPMVWWPLCMVGTLAVAVAMAIGSGMPAGDARLAERETFLIVACTLFSFTTCLMWTWARSCSIYAGFTGLGWPAWLAATALLPIGWICCAAFWLLFVPWMAGLAWIYLRLL